MRNLVFLVLLTCGSAQANIINGSFESGLLGWSSLGGTGAVGDVGRYNPTDGILQGVAQTSIGLDAISDATIIAALGLPPEPPVGHMNFFELRRIQYGPPPEMECPDKDNCFTERSAAVWQTFEAKAGKTIVFDFNFLTAEPCCSTPDAAFVVMSTENTDTGILLAESFTFTVLADPVGGYTPSGTASTLAILQDVYTGLYPEPDLGDTGYLQYSLIVPETGLVTLAFVALNTSDGERTSALLVDNVRLVPEPTTLLLLGLGLAGLGVARRRLHSQEIRR